MLKMGIQSYKGQTCVVAENRLLVVGKTSSPGVYVLVFFSGIDSSKIPIYSCEYKTVGIYMQYRVYLGFGEARGYFEL